jgi:hypothetical protein
MWDSPSLGRFRCTCHHRGIMACSGNLRTGPTRMASPRKLRRCLAHRGDAGVPGVSGGRVAMTVSRQRRFERLKCSTRLKCDHGWIRSELEVGTGSGGGAESNCGTCNLKTLKKNTMMRVWLRKHPSFHSDSLQYSIYGFTWYTYGTAWVQDEGQPMQYV